MHCMQAYLSDIAKTGDFGAETCSRVIPKTVQKKRSPTILVGYSESDIGADRHPGLSVVKVARRDPAARRKLGGAHLAGAPTKHPPAPWFEHQTRDALPGEVSI